MYDDRRVPMQILEGNGSTMSHYRWMITTGAGLLLALTTCSAPPPPAPTAPAPTSPALTSATPTPTDSSPFTDSGVTFSGPGVAPDRVTDVVAVSLTQDEV